MVLESGPRKPNPYNPSPQRVPRELRDDSGLVPLPRPELPSDGRFAASASDTVIGLAMESGEVHAAADRTSASQQLDDQRIEHGYI